MQNGIDYSDPDEPLDYGEWTTHRDTRKGDLVLMYWSAPAKHIAQLVEVTLDAYEDNWYGPAWSCEFNTHIRFQVPLTLDQMRGDKLLESEFSAMRGFFRQRVYEVTPVVWDRLMEMVGDLNPSKGAQIRRLNRPRVLKKELLEKDIEDALEKNLDVLRPKWKLRLYERQFACRGLGWIDLLCRDRKGWVVIELKRGRATGLAASQTAAYMGWIDENLPEAGKPVRGLVIARGADRRFRLVSRATPNLDFLDLEDIAGDLGLKLP